jgi:hypothetical protein
MLRLALILAILASFGVAQAEKKMDWTPFLETKSDRPLAIRSTPTATDDAPAAAPSKSKQAKKRTAKASKKAKVSKKAKRKKR